MAGPIPYPESEHPESLHQQPLPESAAPQGGPASYPGMVPSAYPGALPPPLMPPTSRRTGFVVAAVAVLAVAAVVAAVVFVAQRGTGSSSAVAVTDASATTAIQGYLDALSQGDDETVARNNSCGFFDAVTDRRSDMSLANLTSDAFRRQYGSAKVSTIDKIVTWSPTQAQVLFTMRATPAGRAQGEVERQGIAQLLIQDRTILVCSYLPRNTGQF